jgi:hypothetical protein
MTVRGTTESREMILDAAETVLSYFGFDRTVYGTPRKNRKKKMKWYDELHDERTKDIVMDRDVVINSGHISVIWTCKVVKLYS